jgi:hypothetical protein
MRAEWKRFRIRQQRSILVDRSGATRLKSRFIIDLVIGTAATEKQAENLDF